MQQDRPPDPTLAEVSDGVFAYLQLHGQWGLNNAGFFVGKDSVTLIDTCFTERRARELADAVQRIGGHRAVRTLVNTHHHGDHTYGNFVFGPTVTIIGHEKCREEMIATGLGTKAIWPDVDWGNIKIEPPNVTFRERLTIFAGELEVRLIHVGPAHTTNDIVAWVPERKLLFSGDVVFNGGTPFVLFGSVKGSLKAIETIRALGAETIVPGHGQVAGPGGNARPEELLDGIAAYLRFVQATAKRGYKAGLTPLALAQETDLGAFGALHDRERLAGNLHRAYSELRGEPLGAPVNVMAAFGDMTAYNGGETPKCLA